MSKPKILVTRRWPEVVETRLAELFDVTLNDTDTALSHDDFRTAFASYDAILPTVSDSIPKDAYSVEGLSLIHI